MQGFSEASSDSELLAYLLGAQADKAGRLLERFRTLGHVIAADQLALEAEGVGEQPRALFHAVREAARRLAQQRILEQSVLTHHQHLMDYCHATLAWEPVEQVRILFLDTKNRLIADEPLWRGTVNHSPVYPREIMKRALTLNATAIVLLHNHPSGDPRPSRDDIEITRQVVDAGKTLGVDVHDHIIFAAAGHASFRALGLL
jgi:DNA repair protein RadC